MWTEFGLQFDAIKLSNSIKMQSAINTEASKGEANNVMRAIE
jgi:hypothetical protein